MNKKSFLFAAFIGLLLLMLALEVFNLYYTNKTVEYELIYGILSRGIGSLVCLLMMAYCSFLHLFSSFGKLKSFIYIIPCCLIAINNFPFVSVFNGTAILSAEWYLIILFAIQCFLVGFFEEAAFRGCVFMLLLEKSHNTRKDVFCSIVYSSLIFGAIHIVNLFAGAGIVPVVLQLGYSFLIGSMCAVVLLVTKKLWLPIIIHSVFNFAGGLVPTLGKGEIWNMPTVILTVVVSVMVCIYTVLLFLKYDIEEYKKLLIKNKN